MPQVITYGVNLDQIQANDSINTWFGIALNEMPSGSESPRELIEMSAREGCIFLMASQFSHVLTNLRVDYPEQKAYLLVRLSAKPSSCDSLFQTDIDSLFSLIGKQMQIAIDANQVISQDYDELLSSAKRLGELFSKLKISAQNACSNGVEVTAADQNDALTNSVSPKSHNQARNRRGQQKEKVLDDSQLSEGANSSRTKDSVPRVGRTASQIHADIRDYVIGLVISPDACSKLRYVHMLVSLHESAAHRCQSTHMLDDMRKVYRKEPFYTPLSKAKHSHADWATFWREISQNKKHPIFASPEQATKFLQSPKFF